MYYSANMTAEAFPTTPRRERSSNIITLRLVNSGWDWIEAHVKTHSITQTEVVKAALAFAAAHPKEFAKTITDRKER